MENTLELYWILLQSIEKFTIKQLHNDLQSQFYSDTINKINDITNRTRLSLGLVPIIDILNSLENTLLIEQENVKHLKLGFRWFNDPKPSIVLAYTHAIDIINSIKMRFILGGESVYYTKPIVGILK